MIGYWKDDHLWLGSIMFCSKILNEIATVLMIMRQGFVLKVPMRIDKGEMQWLALIMTSKSFQTSLSLCLHDLAPCIQKDGDSEYPVIMCVYSSFEDNVQLNSNKEIKGCRWCFPNLPKSISAMLELTGLFSLPGSLGISSGTHHNIFILDVCALSQRGVHTFTGRARRLFITF